MRKEIRGIEAKIQEEDGGEKERRRSSLTLSTCDICLSINRSSDPSVSGLPRSITSSFPPLACEPKVYENAGLRKTFKSKNKETFDPLSSGGLDDDDALSTRPAFPQARSSRQVEVRRETDGKDLVRDQTRKNEVGLTLSHLIQ